MKCDVCHTAVPGTVAYPFGNLCRVHALTNFVRETQQAQHGRVSIREFVLDRIALQALVLLLTPDEVGQLPAGVRLFAERHGVTLP